MIWESRKGDVDFPWLIGEGWFLTCLVAIKMFIMIVNYDSHETQFGKLITRRERKSRVGRTFWLRFERSDCCYWQESDFQHRPIDLVIYIVRFSLQVMNRLLRPLLHPGHHLWLVHYVSYSLCIVLALQGQGHVTRWRHMTDTRTSNDHYPPGRRWCITTLSSVGVDEMCDVS